MQRDAAQQLHVEVTHAQRALAGLADDREGFGQHVFERRAVGDPLAKLVGLGAQRLVGKRGDRRLERVDRADLLAVGLEQPLVAAAEHAGEDVRDHSPTFAAASAKNKG